MKINAPDKDRTDPREECIGEELEELLRKIEELRSRMIKTKEGRSYSDPEVIAASQELDAVLDKYQEKMIKRI